MSGGVYGGDEVGALVFDPGHFSFRVGYAGEDCPKSEIPAMVGISEGTSASEGDIKSESMEVRTVLADLMDLAGKFLNHTRCTYNKLKLILQIGFKVDGQKIEPSNVTKKYHIDTVGLHYPKKGMDVATYIKDGMIEDWEMFEQMLDYSYAKVLKSESEYHPVLFSEAPVSTLLSIYVVGWTIKKPSANRVKLQPSIQSIFAVESKSTS